MAPSRMTRLLLLSALNYAAVSAEYRSSRNGHAKRQISSSSKALPQRVDCADADPTCDRIIETPPDGTPPAAQGDPIDIHTLQAINPQLLDTLALYAQYAAASYCTFNIEHPSGPDPLNCHGLEDVANPVGGPVGAGPNPAQKRKQKRQEVAAGNGTQIDVCPRVETLQTKTLFEWENEGFADNSGYIAVDESNKQIILAYRGTQHWNQWLSDFHAYPQVTVKRICGYWCWLHPGFYNSFLETEDAIRANLTAAIQAYPDHKVVFVGHSLGGALATIAATIFRGEGITLDLYTYGAPRVGNLNFAWHVSYQGMGNNYRVSHVSDPFPGLPPKGYTYSHHWPNYYITSGNDVPVTPQDVDEWWWALPPPQPAEWTNVTAVQFRQPPVGFDQSAFLAPTLPNIRAHLWYFMSLTGCNPKGEQELLSLDPALFQGATPDPVPRPSR